MHLAELQQLLHDVYYERDQRRGTDATFRWLTEEVGELARALRRNYGEERPEELADVLAWLMSLANLLGVDMEKAAARYADGCPKCSSIPCTCAF